MATKKKRTKSLTMEFIGRDFFGNKTFKSVKSPLILKKVDGRFHTVTKSIGEPLAPISDSIKVTILKKKKKS